MREDIVGAGENERGGDSEGGADIFGDEFVIFIVPGGEKNSYYWVYGLILLIDVFG